VFNSYPHTSEDEEDDKDDDHDDDDRFETHSPAPAICRRAARARCLGHHGAWNAGTGHLFRQQALQ
jgi:hypothetical protein